MGDRHRIAIIGAGPGGTSCALALLRLGIDPSDIVLYDRASFPRDKLCGGVVNYRGTLLLKSLIEDLPVRARSDGLELRWRGRSIAFREPGQQWLFDRRVLDFALVDECRRRGVEVRDGTAVTDLSPRAGQWWLETASGGALAEWVVGADGALGISRRAAHLAPGRFGRLIEGVFEAVEAAPSASTLVFDLAPLDDGIQGYAWVFPFPRPGADKLWKIGIMDRRGIVSGAQLREWTRAYARRSGFRAVESRLPGWPEHYYSPRSRAHRPGLILVGEALGIDSLLGEGIAPAIASAHYAAGRLRGALARGRDRIPAYELGFLLSQEGRNLVFQDAVADHLFGPRGTRSLEILFGSSTVEKLAGGGRLTYGRMTRHVPEVSLALVRRFARKGRARLARSSGPAPPGEC